MLRAPILAVRFNKTTGLIFKNVRKITALAKTNEPVTKTKLFTKYFLATNLCISSNFK
jgi:hypothetical protein